MKRREGIPGLYFTLLQLRQIDLNESGQLAMLLKWRSLAVHIKEGFKEILRAEMNTFVPSTVVRLEWNGRLWKCLQSQSLVDSVLKISQMEISCSRAMKYRRWFRN